MELKPEDPGRRHLMPYPMELGSPAFQPVAVLEEKDKSINVARAHAAQEYERIMQQAEVLIKLAKALQYRLNMSERVANSDWSFIECYGVKYYLYLNDNTEKETLSLISPSDWYKCPDHLHYQDTVRKQGDCTWIEVFE